MFQLDATYSILGVRHHRYRTLLVKIWLNGQSCFWENHKYDDNSLELKDS